ncbi:MAG TPA: FIST N-terminal domain-containing protein [Acidimicrobiales bacterium]|nr:FIST N-terminal domain-containing protein [Acidimicrobiales bacterium]
MARFAAAMSEHPVTAHAVGEVAGQVLERVGAGPDLALVFVTPPHAGALEDAAAAVRELLSPRVLLGCAAESVVGTGREVERDGAVCLWAGWTGQLAPIDLDTAGPTGPVLGWPQDPGFEPQVLLLLADPFTFPAEAFFQSLATSHPGLRIAGGMASAGGGPGGNRLVLDDQLRTTGAVGVALGAGARVTPVVSQGCRPIGRPLVVTKAEGNVIHELAGEPALERLEQVARTSLTDREVELINQGGLHLGRVVDEHQESFDSGDFLVRNVLGADRETGSVAVGDLVDTGTTVQFHLRDAEAADRDLRQLLTDHTAEASLLFTCNGRGTRLFGEPHHDAGVLADLLGPVPTAGFFAAGEFGPVAGRNFVHGFTASLLLFSA